VRWISGDFISLNLSHHWDKFENHVDNLRGYVMNGKTIILYKCETVFQNRKGDGELGSLSFV
jgi:hypothetical protein